MLGTFETIEIVRWTTGSSLCVSVILDGSSNEDLRVFVTFVSGRVPFWLYRERESERLWTGDSGSHCLRKSSHKERK